jgi:hypothetical protein
MPYIPDTQRNDIHNDLLADGLGFCPENAAELNYIVSELINNFLTVQGLTYSNINEMMGALECCKLELYRVVAAPYEEDKMEENGVVYSENFNA